MAKICIILSSLYGSDAPSFFNAEVQHDLGVVRETLQDHIFLEITFPLKAARAKCNKMIRQCLKLIDIDESTDCHIVLNTHGIPGYSDLNIDNILYLVETLSIMQANIIQISGLQCDGMKQLSIPKSSIHPYKRSMPNFDIDTKKISREANLYRLQKKLSRLVLEKEQSFKIFGFEAAYDPFDNEEEVKQVLTGQYAHQIQVSIASSMMTETYLLEIEEKLALLRNHRDLEPKSYDKIANFFAKLQKNMKNQLLIALEKNIEIGSDSPLWCLMQSLTEYAQLSLPHLEPHNKQHIETIYKNWLKTYKLYSEERINAIGHYARVTLEHMLRNSKAVISPPV